MPRQITCMTMREPLGIPCAYYSSILHNKIFPLFIFIIIFLLLFAVPMKSWARLVDMPPPDLEIAATAKSPQSKPPQSKADKAGKNDSRPAAAGGTIPIDDNFLIVEVRLNDLQLSEALPAYLNQGSIMLPMTELVRAVDFPIRVRPENGTAEGWFLRENQLFTLDLSQAVAVVKGVKMPFSPALVGIIEDDIFVDVRLIAKWFPIDINFDLSNLLVNLESREPLPIEQRLAREDRRRKTFGRRGKKGPGLPRLNVPYKWVGWPITDSAMTFNFNKSDTGNTKAFEQTTFITGDIGMLNAEGFFASNQNQEFTQARVKFGRRDPDGHLLGKLQATDFSFGDITSPQLSMISRTQLGRGVTLSNVPLDQPAEFDRITLEGDLPNGWEVEVYRNEVLLDFRVSRTDGRYVFQDVPLLFGVNVVRLAFYGPQGQFREETRQIRVDADQVKPGEHQYRVAFNQHSRQLFLNTTESASTNGNRGKNRATFEYATGITKNFSVATGFASLPVDGITRNYASVSGRASFGNVFTRADVVRNLSEGWALKFAGRTSLFGVNLIAEHDRLYDFVSEQFDSTSDPVNHDTTIRMDGSLNPYQAVHLPFSLSADHTENRSGDTSSSLSGRLSGAIGAATVTKTLSWQVDRTESSRTTSANGSFLVGGRLGHIRVRGQLSYLLEPTMEFTSSSVSGDWRVNERFNASAGVNVDLTETGETTFSAGVNTDLKVAALGVNMDYSTNNEINARITLSFSSARDPHGSGLKPIMTSDRMASSGAMSVRVFLDKNANGVFDKDDEPLPGARFRVNGTKRMQATNAEGYAFITGIAAHTLVEFAIDKGSLEDPYWLAEPEGMEVVLRPGVTGEMKVAVVTTGEIDGTIYRRRGDWADPVADVNMQLVDTHGKVVKEARSAYDGFYLIDYIRPGKYTLRADPEQIARLDLQAPDPQPVEIAGSGTIVNGKDIFLDRLRAERTYRVLLTSFLSREAALAAWAKLKAELPNPFRTLRSMVEVHDTGGERGVVHNLFVGPLSAREDGERLCINVRNLRDTVWCNPLTIQAR